MTASSADGLILRDVSAGYRADVVTSISGSFAPGSISMLIGPNGAGKSTLLKAVLGITPRLSGDMSWAGQGLPGQAIERAKHIAYVPQFESDALGHTVRETVLMGRLPWSVGVFESEDDREIARGAMEKCDIAHLATRVVSDLSGGERQRVWLARAIAQQTPILLLDEPTSHLDPAHMGLLTQALHEYAAGGGTILAATHDINWAMHLGDQLVALAHGQALWIGPSDHVKEAEVLEKAFGTPFAWASREEGQWVVVPSYWSHH